MAGVVATEIMALAWRHWLLERLAGRSDILGPAPIAPTLARRIGRFLVAGLDYAGEPGAEGWPVPTGGRYAKLCFSTVFGEGAYDFPGLHILPVTIDDYLTYVETICGIGQARADDLFRLFRFTPAWLFEQTADLRTGNGYGWRLLLSNEFRLTRQLHPGLGWQVEKSAFKRPLIHGFMVIAELERAHLIMRHLGRAQAIIGRPELLDRLWLSLPLSNLVAPGELIELHRWLEYAGYSSTTLRTFLFDLAPKAIIRLPAGFGPWAAARSEMAAGAAAFVDDPAAREVLIKALTPPPVAPPREKRRGRLGDNNPPAPVERRKPLLRNHDLWRWYGLTNAVLPVVALDGIRDLLPTTSAPGEKRRGPSPRTAPARAFLASLAAVMRHSADPAAQDAVERAARKYVGTARRDKSVQLEANSKAGLDLARLYLPSHPRDGSGARFNHTMWLTPTRDAAFWRMLLDLRRGGRLSRYRPPTIRSLRPLAGILRRAYGPLFRDAVWSDLTARIVCDLAAAIGPISGNLDIAHALHALGGRPRIQRRLGAPIRSGFGKGKKASKATSKIATNRR